MTDNLPATTGPGTDLTTETKAIKPFVHSSESAYFAVKDSGHPVTATQPPDAKFKDEAVWAEQAKLEK